MKRFIAMMMVVGLLAGCSGMQIGGGDQTQQAIGYVAGKGVGYAVYKYAPKSGPALATAWKDMMTRNATVDPIPGSEIMVFYNQSALILSGEVKDPYGLLSDMAALMAIYGGQFSPDGNMTMIKDVPKAVATLFEMGYRSGKLLAER